METTPGKYERYLIVAQTPTETLEIEVPSMSGPEFAKRRTHVQLAHSGYCDLGESEIVSCRLLDPSEYTD